VRQHQHFGNRSNALGQNAGAALEKAMKLRQGSDGCAWFFFAMICQRTGNEAEARTWFDRAMA
jgi:hypothetical protein